ncbi:GIY-YIG nuclease family protein [Microvirga antarctica]|uniref:GIY-YIG nuclease family protein n=1 Tax=Microvirga antarctica TaxID=2819233 RepID=UPI001B300403|nr:GIY-YIG nuclease family protein [Microvirga antarctica]
MKSADRKAATAAYKERKTAPGIYVVRCIPTGDQWVGRAPDLATIQNRIWFSLAQGAQPQRALQAAWTTHGAESFVFEEVERLEDEETLAYVRDGILKERLAHWCATLGAKAI